MIHKTERLPSKGEYIRTQIYLEESPTIDSIPSLLSDLLTTKDADYIRVQSELEEILKKQVFQKLEQTKVVIHSMSNPLSAYYLEQWEKLRKEDIQTLTLAKCAIFHRNGRIRQAACHYLAEQDLAGHLDFLLILLSDYIPEIRQEVSIYMTKYITIDQLYLLLPVLSTIVYLEQRKRANYQELHQKIEELYITYLKMNTFKGYAHSDYRVVRMIYQIALMNSPDQEQVLSLSVGHTDRVIRNRAAEYICREMIEENYLNWLPTLLKSKDSQVRQKALTKLVQMNSTEYTEIFKGTLSDSSRRNREIAQFYFRTTIPEFDLTLFYSKQLSEANQSRILETLIMGVGEVGGKLDALKISDYCQHPKSKIRLAAFQTVGHLNLAENQSIFLTGLQDHSKKVSYWSMLYLGQISEISTFRKVEKICYKTTELHVFYNGLMMLKNNSKKNYLFYLLDLLTEVDVAKQTIIIKLIGSWCVAANRYFFVQLNSFEEIRFTQLIKKNSLLLNEELIKKLKQAVNFNDYYFLV